MKKIHGSFIIKYKSHRFCHLAMKWKTSTVATLDIYLTYKSIDRKRDTWLEWRNSSLFLWSSSRDCEILKMRFNLEKSPVWTRELSNAISGARARSNVYCFYLRTHSGYLFESVLEIFSVKK